MNNKEGVPPPPLNLTNLPPHLRGVPPPPGAPLPLGLVPPPPGVVPPPLGGVPPPPSGRLPQPPAHKHAVNNFPIPPTNFPPPAPLQAIKPATLPSKPSPFPPAKPVQKPVLSRPVAKLKGKLASVFNADESSDEEEIPAEARYTQNSFICTFHLLQQQQRHVVGKIISSWGDLFLQNENEKRGSGNDYVQRAQQFRKDEEGLHRCKQALREELAGGHGHRVKRQQRPGLAQKVALLPDPTIKKFSSVLSKIQVLLSLCFSSVANL